MNTESAEIIDYITSRIDTLKFVKQEVLEYGFNDTEITGKIIELENLRMWISDKYFLNK